MSWRTFDSFDSKKETIDVMYFRVGTSDGSFSKMNDIFEMVMNAHNYLNDNMHRIFAKYLFMCNKPAEMIMAYRSEEEVRTVERNWIYTTCLVLVGYRDQMTYGYARPKDFCGKAKYTTQEHSTTLQEVPVETISSMKMPGEAYRVHRSDIKLVNLNLMG